MTITEEEARRIAHEDAERVYRDLSMYAVFVEREHDTWRIGYRPSDPFTVGGGPQYVISRETGEIISRHYEQ